MLITHTIYGRGVIVGPAAGTFVLVRFEKDLPDGLRKLSPHGPNTLAVGLCACKEGWF